MPCLVGLADALLNDLQGTDGTELDASFASLLDQLAARALATVESAPLDIKVSHSSCFSKCCIFVL